LIDVTPPTVNMETPEEWSVFRIGEIILFSGTAGDNAGVSSIEMVFDCDKGNATEVISSYKSGKWSYELETADLEDGYHSMDVWVYDEAGNSAFNMVQFTLLEVENPEVSITTPTNNSIFKLGESVKFTGIATDNKKVTWIHHIIDDNEPVNISREYQVYGDYWSFTWSTTDETVEEGLHRFEVRAFDAVGNYGSDVIYFELDGSPPEVEITSPAENTIFSAGDEIIIKGTASDNYGVATVELFLDNFDPINITKYLVDDEWEYDDWDTSKLFRPEPDIKVRVTDIMGFQTETAIVIIIDAEVPVVDIIEIYNTILVGDTITLEGTASDDLEIVHLELIVENGEPLNITARYIDKSWSCEFDTSNLTEGNLKFAVRATDIVGKQGTDEISVKFISYTTDEDGDEIPDWWEIEHGLNPRTTKDADRDKDNDGFTNLQEYLGDDGLPGNDDYSDPNDESSVPQLKKDGSDDERVNITAVWITIVIIMVIIFIIIIANDVTSTAR
jgi:hypothetical protein